MYNSVSPLPFKLFRATIHDLCNDIHVQSGFTAKEVHDRNLINPARVCQVSRFYTGYGGL